MEILILAILITLNGFFAMAEIAIVSSKKSKLEKEARSGSKGAKTALKLLDKPEDFLSTVQIGITLIGIFAGAFGGISLAEDLVPYFQQFNNLKEYAFEISFIIIVGGITYFSLIIGELVPKSIAFNNPEGIAIFVAPFMSALSVITKPVVVFLSWSTKLLLKIFFIEPKPEQPISEEELKILLEHGAKHGSFDKYEADIIRSIFRFGDRDAYSIMTNRRDIVWIDKDVSAEEIKKILLANSFSHYPVCEGNLDNIIGIVNTQSLLSRLSTSGEFDIKELVYEPVYIPDSLSSFRVIEKFKTSKRYVAIVVDESGAIEGMITKQDILENIIGELPEDITKSEDVIVKDNASWLVRGFVHIDELVDKTELNLVVNEDQYVTLGGFVMSSLGKIPVKGDKFRSKGYLYEVVEMDGKRVDKVLIRAEKDE